METVIGDWLSVLEALAKDKERLLIMILLITGLALVGIGVLTGFGRKGSSTDPTVRFLEAEEGSSSAASQTAKLIFIDVEGAVARPGVYKVPNDSRIVDALIPAGGLAENADRNYLSKHINLAQRVSDGMKIYIPAFGEGLTTNSDGERTISINTGDAAELDTLPGVGPATAQKIIAGRPYNSLEELIGRGVLTASQFAKIKGQVGL